MKPIYEPKGRAKEYGDYAINIYTGCPHRCYYCFAPSVLRKEREYFHNNVKPRVNIVEAIKRQIEAEKISDKLIHLCFTCDPYPLGHDSTATREAIKAIKDSGNHVQILTKNGIGAQRDFDLLDSEDWFGVTYAGYKTSPVLPPEEEQNAGWPIDRFRALVLAKSKGINTWVSFAPPSARYCKFQSLHRKFLHRWEVERFHRPERIHTRLLRRYSTARCHP